MNRSHRLVAWIALTALCSSWVGCMPRRGDGTLPHFDAVAPAVGSVFPELELVDVDGQPVVLNDLAAEKPLVVQLGSYSCPVFRIRSVQIDALRQEYGDRVEFVVVYTVEAHPLGSKSPYADGEWVSWYNWVTGTLIEQPATHAERLDRATLAKQDLDLELRVTADCMRDRAWNALGRAPTAAFLVEKGGRVRLSQPWAEPDELRREIELLLAQAGSEEVRVALAEGAEARLSDSEG